jgi:hypothetical protein
VDASGEGIYEENSNIVAAVANDLAAHQDVTFTRFADTDVWRSQRPWPYNLLHAMKRRRQATSASLKGCLNSSPAPPYQLCEARGRALAIAENSFPRKFAERFLVFAMGIDVRIEGLAECALQDAQDMNKQN